MLVMLSGERACEAGSLGVEASLPENHSGHNFKPFSAVSARFPQRTQRFKLLVCSAQPKVPGPKTAQIYRPNKVDCAHALRPRIDPPLPLLGNRRIPALVVVPGGSV
jgi:hypothetical protein